MIRIQQLKLKTDHSRRELEQKIRKELRLRPEEEVRYEIVKRSIDARKKPELYYSYIIDCKVSKQQSIYKRTNHKNVVLTEEKHYQFPLSGTKKMSHPPVIVGTGPAGLFCGLLLAKHGYRPILLERGMDADTRAEDVTAFWNGQALKEDSNVQFGEGGAGTFSDGKLNTLVKDKNGRNKEVLRLLVKAGADASIQYENKPHIGTDVLIEVVKNIRKQIEAYGGKVCFGKKVTGICTENGRLTGLVINDRESQPCETAIFAIGHSARDTFRMLYEAGFEMEAKEFAAGFRAEHAQSKINLSQYGRENPAPLTAAPYKVTAKTAVGRGVYSFCMCPGGYVVNASSEQGHLAVNGMSYSKRNGTNANSAIIVSVKKSDFSSEHPLAGIEFQRRLEKAAYQAGGGKIPVQRLGDLKACFYQKKKDAEQAGRPLAEQTDKANQTNKMESALMPCMKGSYVFSDLSDILPQEMTEAFLEGMGQFAEKIEGFDADDTLISAVESRTSSPVRILRNELFESNIKGMYPCGEGAGYAGGITSAAMDGMRIAEAIAAIYQPFEEIMKK